MNPGTFFELLAIKIVMELRNFSSVETKFGMGIATCNGDMQEKDQGPHKTVLLIDDEKDMDWVIGKILTDAGYRVVTAKTGAEGLAKFRAAAHSIHLVLLDLRLPDMSGLDLLEKIKAISSRTKVLMITAFGTPEARKLARRKGAVEVLDKPFRVEKVLKAARLAFEGSS